MIYMIKFIAEPIEDMKWPELDRVELDREADRLMCVLNAKLLPHGPIPHDESVQRLELQVEDEKSANIDSIHRSALAHIALADYN